MSLPVQTPPAASGQVETKPPPQRDLREELVPGDPLGIRPGDGSIARIATSPDSLRLSAIASSEVEPGLSVDERERSRRQEMITVVLVVCALAILGLWLFRRRGRVNFAGHGHNR